MKYRVAAEVEGTAFIKENFTVVRDQFSFEFFSDIKGRLSHLRVTCCVPDERVSEFKMILKDGDQQSKPVFGFGLDYLLHRQIVDELQRLESNLGVFIVGGVTRIRWDEAYCEPIPETPEERAVVNTPAHQIIKRYEIAPYLIGQELIQEAIDPIYDSLQALGAFWREGMRQYAQLAYVPAFYNFYFVIEDLFADGKTAEKEVFKSFAKYPEFAEICREVIDELRKEDRLVASLMRFLHQEKCELNVSGVQRLLFRMRGNLHHFFRKSPRTRGTPFNQHEFEGLTKISMEISHKAISREIHRIRGLRT